MSKKMLIANLHDIDDSAYDQTFVVSTGVLTSDRLATLMAIGEKYYDEDCVWTNDEKSIIETFYGIKVEDFNPDDFSLYNFYYTVLSEMRNLSLGDEVCLTDDVVDFDG